MISFTGYLIACIAGSAQIALDLTNPLLIPLLYIGGFFLRNGSVPFYLEWMRYLSWFMYGNEALSINQWAGVSFNDTSCPNGICTGEQILQSHSFNPVQASSLKKNDMTHILLINNL